MIRQSYNREHDRCCESYVAKKFGTVQKQLGAPWQKISPPSKLPKFVCQPNLFLNKLVLWPSSSVPMNFKHPPTKPGCIGDRSTMRAVARRQAIEKTVEVLREVIANRY